jgi:hypothetical protein
MNPRERILAGILAGLLVVVGGAFVTLQLVLSPIQERNKRIISETDEIESKSQQLTQIKKDLSRLEKWKQLSLPQNVTLARREYEQYLSNLLLHSGFASGSFALTPKPPDTRSSPVMSGKKPIFTRLTFLVAGPARLENLVKFLVEFYRTPLMHEIKTLSIDRNKATGTGPQRNDDLDINMTVEALIVTDGDNRNFLLPNIDRRLLAIDVVMGMQGNSGLGLAVWSGRTTGLAVPSRNYEAIASKNIFIGPAPVAAKKTEDVDVTELVRLTDITKNLGSFEGNLWDRWNNQTTRLRSTSGFDQFRIRDSEGNTIVQGKVMKIFHQDIIFQANDKFYMIHVGDSIKDALENPLPKEMIETLLMEPLKASKKD